MATSPGVALVGFGPWGRNIARNLHRLGALHTVCDPDPASRALAAKEYPNATIIESEQGVAADLAVAIAAPAADHARLAAYFLGRGHHVFVEKPLALRVDECPALLQLAKENGRVLMVGHLLHHHPAVIELDRLVRAGSLGRLQYIYSNRLNLGRFRREENALWSFAPHDIAVLLRLVGSLPARVSAIGSCVLHPKIADSTVTHLLWENGLIAHIYVSWLHPFKEQRLVVVGSEAMAVFDDQQPWADKLVLYRHSVEWKAGVPQPRRADGQSVALIQDEPLEREMRAFLSAVADPTQPIVADGAEGQRVLAVLGAAESSLQSGGLPVELGRLEPPSWADRGVYVHPSAIVGTRAVIGTGSKIWHHSHVMDGARIGANCSLGQNAFVQSGAILGDGVRVQNNVSIYDGVQLGDDVFCGPSCVFTNVSHPRAAVSRKSEYAKTSVGRGATIGANATIVCGNTIGRFAFVGAGAVVTRSVADYALVVGNPARIVGWVCSCGETLALPAKADAARTANCARCAKQWRLNGQSLEQHD
ncbi:MAG: oxidoreductase [Myxococcales bacterium]|nr:oxidoreductase [Myxococcales bacterium]